MDKRIPLQERKSCQSQCFAFAANVCNNGIPQGNLALLFVIYINDLPDVVNSNVLLFTNDTKKFRQVMVDTKMNFQEHISTKVKKANRE